MKQIVNILRSIAELQTEQVSFDVSRRTVTLQTSSDLADMAEWIFNQLDSVCPSPGVHEYIVPGSTDDVVRVSYAPDAADPKELRELVHAIRSLGEVQRIVYFSPLKALVWRGKGWQAGLSEWLISQLENPPVGQSPHCR